MTELLPCPFCGGEAYIYAPGPIEHHVACKNPSCYAETHGWSTEAEAIAAWNTRAEQTCNLTLDGTDGCFGCSRCYENIRPLANYCPNCGAKVVDE